MARRGYWIRSRCCGSTVHIDAEGELTAEELERERAGPCFACKHRQERMRQELAAGLLTQCASTHGDGSGLCYVIPGSVVHIPASQCPCRFRFRSECPVPAHSQHPEARPMPGRVG